jgi:hypothetical protein
MRGVRERHEIPELLQGGHGSSSLSINKSLKIDWHDEQRFATYQSTKPPARRPRAPRAATTVIEEKVTWSTP